MTDSEKETRVLVAANFSEETLDKFRAVSPNLSIHQQARDIPDDILADIEVLYSANSYYPPPEKVPKLRWLQLNSAGAENALRQPIGQQKDIEITSASGIHATQMAEYSMMMMLAFSQNLLRMLEYQSKSLWIQESWRHFVPWPLRDHTLGIVGYGSIGREIARLAASFGMKILACKRDVMNPALSGRFGEEGLGDPEGVIPERIYPAGAVADMVVHCDYVIAAMPLSGHNQAFIDTAVFSAMKPEAYFINVGRGGVVDEAALLHALQSKQIAGAALDVFAHEPLPKESPFWQLDNVIISPHVSGNSQLYRDKAALIFEENLRRYVNKLPLLNRVSKTQGY